MRAKPNLCASLGGLRLRRQQLGRSVERVYAKKAATDKRLVELEREEATAVRWPAGRKRQIALRCIDVERNQLSEEYDRLGVTASTLTKLRTECDRQVALRRTGRVAELYSAVGV